ncbi:MAG: archaea-specific SMC-related protein [Haloplanus sp.]
MGKAELADVPATVRVTNVGGIAETEVDIPPGVTVLAGRNATNRTSFLRSIMAVMGSDDVSLKGDAEEGYVELSLDDETYTRTLRRTNGGVATSGDPYLDDPTIADLFAFLLESNEARRTVARNDDLRELIMRPVDTDEIRAEIDRLQRERDEVEERLDDLDDLKEELPSLEERRADLETKIEDKRDALAEKEAEIEQRDAEVSETRAEKRELEDRLDDLRDLRSELERVRSEIGLQEESIESLRSERSDLVNERQDLPETPMGDHEQLEQELGRLRERKQSLETEVSELQNIIQFNEGMLDGGVDAVTDVLGDRTDSQDLTDQLVAEEQTVCWTCGSEVERERIEEMIEKLRSVRQEYLDDVRDIESELDDLRETQRERETQQRRRETVERKIEEIDDELDRRQEELESLRDRREALNEEVETTETEVEQLESENFSEVLDLHKEANQLEFDLGQLESDLDDVTDRIADVESRLSEESELETRRERLQEDLQSQRTRIDRIEREAVDGFNEHMEAVLDLLDYENLARIWIERVQRTVREGRRNVEQTAFELHVVRTTDSGTSYEDTIDHLSESEREVTGLVFALAGYLVHEVYETVPFMVLDSLEAIDSERLADLVAYFSEYVPFLVVALLPEDAQAVTEFDARITEI